MSLSFPARALLLAAVAAAAWPVRAQPASPDPSAASAPVPAVKYQSLLSGYRPFTDDGAKSWRQNNDAAASFGGWRAYAREVRQPAPSQVAPAASAAHGAAHPVRGAP